MTGNGSSSKGSCGPTSYQPLAPSLCVNSHTISHDGF